jgi:hypothetical protein
MTTTGRFGLMMFINLAGAFSLGVVVARMF